MVSVEHFVKQEQVRITDGIAHQMFAFENSSNSLEFFGIHLNS